MCAVYLCQGELSPLSPPRRTVTQLSSLSHTINIVASYLFHPRNQHGCIQCTCFKQPRLAILGVAGDAAGNPRRHKSSNLQGPWRLKPWDEIIKHFFLTIGFSIAIFTISVATPPTRCHPLITPESSDLRRRIPTFGEARPTASLR